MKHKSTDPVTGNRTRKAIKVQNLGRAVSIATVTRRNSISDVSPQFSRPIAFNHFLSSSRTPQIETPVVTKKSIKLRNKTSWFIHKREFVERKTNKIKVLWARAAIALFLVQGCRFNIDSLLSTPVIQRRNFNLISTNVFLFSRHTSLAHKIKNTTRVGIERKVGGGQDRREKEKYESPSKTTAWKCNRIILPLCFRANCFDEREWIGARLGNVARTPAAVQDAFNWRILAPYQNGFLMIAITGHSLWK